MTKKGTTFRTSKGVVVSVAYPDIYIQPGYVVPADVTNPAEMREALREKLLLDPYIKSVEDRVIKPFAGNPVFSYSGIGGGTFDSDGVGEPSVIRYQGKYYMVYEAMNAAGIVTIGLVNSDDGINWSNRTQILTPGAPGDWDEGNVVTPEIYLDGNYFYLFYTGFLGTNNGVGVARANAIGGPYVKLGQLLSRGSVGQWDHGKFDMGALVKYAGVYYLFYEAAPGVGHPTITPSQSQMGLATATSITGPYTKYAGNPVLPFGSTFDWDSFLTKDFSVVVTGDIFYVVYWGNSYAPGGTIGFTGGMGMAYSLDGKTWVKSPKNPLLTRTTITGEFPTGTIQSFNLVNLGNGLWAIYCEGNYPPNVQIGIEWLIHREQKVKTAQKVIDVTSIGIGATQSVTFNNLGVEDLAVAVKVTYGGAATSGVRAYLLASHDRTSFDSQNTTDAYTYFEPSFLAGGTRQRTVPVDPRTAWLRLSINNLDAAVAQGAVEAWLHRVERYEHLMGI